MHSVFQENYKMASIKVKFRPSTANDREGKIYYQVIHKRKVRQIKTGYSLFPDEWNARTSSVRVPAKASHSRSAYLQSVNENIRRECRRMNSIFSFFESKDIFYTADDAVEKFKQQTYEQSLFLFMQNMIGQMKRINRVRTSETYAAALASFMKFRNGKDILLCEADSEMMTLYESWLKSRGICPNSSSFYMRILRAVYNRAVDKGLIQQKFPFKHVYTGIDKTVKRAISMKYIKHIKELDLSLKPHLDYARDMFLFSFYTRGMSFIDMSYLRKTDLRNGILIYRRKKTSQQLSIRWEKCMDDIVRKYIEYSTSVYMLPIISDDGTDDRRQYMNALSRINVSLKKIASMIGLTIPLTMYCARHTWANVAKSKNIPISVISEGMGHDSEETTRIYLAALDTSIVDDANSLILNDL